MVGCGATPPNSFGQIKQSPLHTPPFAWVAKCLDMNVDCSDDLMLVVLRLYCVGSYFSICVLASATSSSSFALDRPQCFASVLCVCLRRCDFYLRCFARLCLSALCRTMYSPDVQVCCMLRFPSSLTNSQLVFEVPSCRCLRFLFVPTSVLASLQRFACRFPSSVASRLSFTELVFELSRCRGLRLLRRADVQPRCTDQMRIVFSSSSSNSDVADLLVCLFYCRALCVSVEFFGA
mmetsp:Transcript_77064/g.249465  ORF Transcript_77064/g.249465 Transcript_77064/m.249465 type:complete len:235 (-) Transcript_77064:183-887(-)